MTHTTITFSAETFYDAMLAYWHGDTDRARRDAADLAAALRAAAMEGRIRLGSKELANVETIIRATEREERS